MPLSKEYVPVAGDSIEYPASSMHEDLVRSKFQHGFPVSVSMVRRIEGVDYVFEVEMEADTEKGYPWYTIQSVRKFEANKPR